MLLMLGGAPRTGKGTIVDMLVLEIESNCYPWQRHRRMRHGSTSRFSWASSPFLRLGYLHMVSPPPEVGPSHLNLMGRGVSPQPVLRAMNIGRWPVYIRNKLLVRGPAVSVPKTSSDWRNPCAVYPLLLRCCWRY